MSDFIEMIKDEVAERLENKIGRREYVCDIGFSLTEGENCNGSWYCSEYEAKEDLKRHFDEMAEYQSYCKCNFGESDYFESEPYDYHHSIECFHCRMMITAIDCCFNQAYNNAFKDEDIWDDKIEITEEFVSKIKEGLKEITDTSDIW